MLKLAQISPFRLLNQFICACLMVGAILSFSNCSTDFDLTSDYKEIPVIYGLLDQSQEVQYIRVNKAFLSESSALEIANIADSLYFENATVTLRGYSGDAVWQQDHYELGANAQLQETFVLPRIDVSQNDAYPGKNPEGIFASEPYFLYILDSREDENNVLNQDYIYEIVVETGTTTATAVTPLVKSFDIIRPNAEQGLNLLTDEPFIQFNAPINGSIFDLDIVFRYREEANNDPNNFEIKEVTYNILTSQPRNQLVSDNSNFVSFNYSSDAYWNALISRIGTGNDEQFKRVYLPPVEFVFYAGSKDLEQYSLVAGVGENSVNVGQSRPIYTNVQNGIGLFGSRYREVANVGLTDNSFLELLCGENTEFLRFVRQSGGNIECD